MMPAVWFVTAAAAAAAASVAANDGAYVGYGLISAAAAYIWAVSCIR